VTTTIPLPIAADLRLRWVLRLRWAGIAVQVLVVFVTAGQQLFPALAIVAVGAISGLVAEVWLRRSAAGETRIGLSDGLMAAITLVDVAILTTLLVFSGGPLNPYTFLYVVHVATATVALPRRWSWLVAVFAVVAYGILFLPGVFDPEEHMHQMHGPGFFAHVRGMWIAFSITTAFIVLFLGQLRHAMEQRDAEAADLRDARAREQRLASLATLAGGAAHELATPLSTIAIVAESLGSALPASIDAHIRNDVALLSSEVGRCIAVLRQLSSDAGTPGGEQLVLVTGADLLQELDPEARTTRDTIDAAFERGAVRVPRRALVTAIRGLIRNAEHHAGTSVTIRGGTERVANLPMLALSISDDGPGMDDQTLQRVGEPFFTTKAPGEGMGLGVFLARTVVEQAGGTLTFESTLGVGTTVHVTLPLAHHTTRKTA
jgi:two-component system sensor histidine kinase RegB